MSYAELKSKKFTHKGEETGATEDTFYVTDENQVTYEMSAAVYYIWKVSDGTKSLEEIVKQASEELNMPVNELEEPIAMIITKLLESNLLAEVK
ncbi:MULTISPECIES: PqqD family protein [Fervidicoccus]|uniref:PqqD family protein n=1 Tax=Fervidicoccus fontis TaxID=683846 RepID=A0A7C2VIT2_9CREN|nr:PqqD family protein [Fervidicoccus fontis]PMB76230.1 MAG: hypothetical protein C0177_07230 [Fervidicoccus fontis]HEW63803.1 PqqD family protein [Fervidicoccus fontis]